LIKRGKVQRGMLGVTIQQITPDLAAGLGLKDTKGVLIGGVQAGGPADKAGLRSGDVIEQINGKDVSDSNTLRNEIASMGPGSELTMTVLRNGSHQEFHVKLGELNGEKAEQQEENGGGSGGAKLGVELTPLTSDIARQLHLPRGEQGVVVASVDQGGAAADAGVQEGDVIEEVNRQQVRTPGDVRDALAKSHGGPVLLLVNRGGQKVFVAVEE
jgi:serine protease Do